MEKFLKIFKKIFVFIIVYFCEKKKKKHFDFFYQDHWDSFYNYMYLI